MSSLFRIIRTGFQNFFRHGLLTFATIMIMSLTLFSISILVLIHLVTNEAIVNIQKKLDINVQLRNELTDEEIDTFISDLEKNEKIETISYKSKQEALEDFKIRFRSKLDIISFLEKLGQNPLYGSLNIILKDPVFYDEIIKSIESKDNQKFVKDIRGKDEQKSRIERLISITNAVKMILLYLSFGFGFIAFLIILNTIRVTIYTRHQEIVIMKLVGATYSFITFPFLVEGMLYGVFATMLSTAIFFPLVHFLSPFILQYFESSSKILFTYYFDNISVILGGQLLAGSFVGVLSAYLAVRRYLKENEATAERE